MEQEFSNTRGKTFYARRKIYAVVITIRIQIHSTNEKRDLCKTNYLEWLKTLTLFKL